MHLGDVTEKADGSIYGDGVNIAARLEGLALPGGVTVSDAVQSAVRHRVDTYFEDLGEQEAKNIVDPVRVYRVSSKVSGGSATTVSGLTRGRGAWLQGSRQQWKVVAAIVLLFVIAALSFAPSGPGQRLVAKLIDSLQLTEPEQVTPITMSLAVGAIATNADAAAPAGAGEALREDLLGGIGSVERQIRVLTIAPGLAPGDFRERALEAGARYFVEGDLRARSGLRNVGLRLIESKGGNQVWSSRFDLPEPAASFEGAVGRRRMVRQVARAIENAEIARVLNKPREQFDAMELVVKAWSVYDRGQLIATAVEARKLTDRALSQDPNLVEGMRLVVSVVDMLNDVDPQPNHERYVRAKPTSFHRGR